jgi:hypothetical protein
VVSQYYDNGDLGESKGNDGETNYGCLWVRDFGKWVFSFNPLPTAYAVSLPTSGEGGGRDFIESKLSRINPAYPQLTFTDKYVCFLFSGKSTLISARHSIEKKKRWWQKTASFDPAYILLYSIPK